MKEEVMQQGEIWDIKQQAQKVLVTVSCAIQFPGDVLQSGPGRCSPTSNTGQLMKSAGCR